MMQHKLAVLLAFTAGVLVWAQTNRAERFRPTFENERTAAFTLDLAPKEYAQVYQSSHETLWIALDDATVSFTHSEKTETKVQFKTGDTRFFPSFQAKSVVNNGGTNFRAALVEIKSRGLTSGGCGCMGDSEKAVCGCANAAHLPELWAVGMGQITLAGTKLAAGDGFRGAGRRDDMLLVAVTDVELRDEANDNDRAAAPNLIPNLTLKSGEAAWVPEGRHRFRNVGTQAARFVTIEF
jgi:hypothetical protein